MGPFYESVGDQEDADLCEEDEAPKCAPSEEDCDSGVAETKTEAEEKDSVYMK